MVAFLVFEAVLSIPPDQRTKPNKTGNSHKRAQSSQTPRSAKGFCLSASTGERAGVRCRNPLTCTVVERDNWAAQATRLRVPATRRHNSEGLLASGDPAARAARDMEKLIEFHETLLFYQNPANGKRDLKHMSSKISHKRAQSSQTKSLRALRSFAAKPFRTRHSAFRISPARQKGILVSDWKETNRLRELEE
ncbi:MAG: hypothetical protein HYY24_18630, partial [Verrucomicrobia bacterium]|nr:hypothetical protein [Verrucomicrobiota bacterium]